MDYIYGLILGLLDGFCEVFPISRAGHRVILEKLFDFPAAIAESGALALLLHCSVLLAVAVAFRKTVWGMLTGLAQLIGGLFSGGFKWRKASRYQRMAVYTILAAIPSAALAVLRHYYDFAAGLQKNLIFIGFMLLVTAGLIYIGTHSICRNWTALDMKPGHALKLGLFQGAASVLPGLSPIGITLSMGRNMGFAAETAMEFAFTLSIPGLLCTHLFDFGALKTVGTLPWGVTAAAMAAAFSAAFGAIALVKRLLKKERYGWFGVYCLLAGAAAIVLNFV